MKKIVLTLSLILTAGLFTVQAQTNSGVKTGYVNSAELISRMPESAHADTVLQQYMAKMSGQYQTMGQEYQRRIQEYQEQKDNWTTAVRETKEKDLNDLQNRLQEFNDHAQDSIQAKKEALLKPLYDRAQKAIEAVGKDGGYDYIYDGSALLYAKDQHDLTADVKAKLGIK